MDLKKTPVLDTEISDVIFNVILTCNAASTRDFSWNLLRDKLQKQTHAQGVTSLFTFLQLSAS